MDCINQQGWSTDLSLDAVERDCWHLLRWPHDVEMVTTKRGCYWDSTTPLLSMAVKSQISWLLYSSVDVVVAAYGVRGRICIVYRAFQRLNETHGERHG